MAARYDLVQGTYRRQYSGFIRGRRICSVSLEAEAWFWRLHALADDWGNLEADPALLPVDAGGRRRISVEQSEKLLKELDSANLIRFYWVRNSRHIQIVDFIEKQPAPRTGNRVRRVESPSSVSDPVNLCVPVRSSALLLHPPGSDSDSDDGGGLEEGSGEKPRPPSGALLLWNQVQPIYDAYPRHRRGGKGAFPNHVAPAWMALVESGESDPGGRLTRIVKAYAASWLASVDKGKACLGPERFFGEGVWEQNPRDWAEPGKSGASGSADAWREVARLKQELALKGGRDPFIKETQEQYQSRLAEMDRLESAIHSATAKAQGPTA